MAKDAKSNKEVKNIKHFFKDFKAELKKVIWPTPNQIVNNTIAVITIVIITAAIVFVLDLVFDIINQKGINQLKENIKNKTAVENVIDDNEENAENEEEAENQEENVEETSEQDETESAEANTNTVSENEPQGESSVENVQ